MKRSLLFMLLCVSVFGCSCSLDERLELADRMFKCDVDSSAVLLAGIDVSSLHSLSQKAWYDLQIWRMLEHNDLDKFMTFNPQRIKKYYRYWGTEDKRAQARFYYGRMLQLRGDLRGAMDCYNQAFELCLSAGNMQVAGRTRYHQSELYETVFYDWDDCIGWLEDAESCFKKAENYEYMVLCEIKIAAILLSHRDYIRGLSQIDCIRADYLQECNDDILSKYYFVKLCSLIYTPYEQNKLKDALVDYIGKIPVPLQEETIVQLAKVALGQTVDKGVEYYDKQVSDGGIWNILRTEVLYRLLEFENSGGELFASLGKYQQKIYEMMSAAISQEVQFSDDNWQIAKNKKRTFIIVFITVMLLAISVVITLLVNYRNIKKNIALTQSLETLRTRFESTISNTSSNNMHMSEYLKDRLDTMNMLIRYCLTNSSASYKKLKARIKEHDLTKEIILTKNTEVFCDIYPKFIGTLRDKGLTDSEIQYCCLYALGMNGKEITEYLGNSGHFNMSSVIRHKLGLTPSDTNLSIYIQRLVSEE